MGGFTVRWELNPDTVVGTGTAGSLVHGYTKSGRLVLVVEVLS